MKKVKLFYFVLASLCTLIICSCSNSGTNKEKFFSEDNEQLSEENNDWVTEEHYVPDEVVLNKKLTYQVKIKTFFHNSPNEASVRKAYLIAGDLVTVLEEKNNFGYVEYINSNNGKVTTGWIKMSDLHLKGSTDEGNMEKPSFADREKPSEAVVDNNWLIGTWEVTIPVYGRNITTRLTFLDNRNMMEDGNRGTYTIDYTNNTITFILNNEAAIRGYGGTPVPFDKNRKLLSAGDGYYYRKN